jgi:hypothetical protein
VIGSLLAKFTILFVMTHTLEPRLLAGCCDVCDNVGIVSLGKLRAT